MIHVFFIQSHALIKSLFTLFVYFIMLYRRHHSVRIQFIIA